MFYQCTTYWHINGMLILPGYYITLLNYGQKYPRVYYGYVVYIEILNASPLAFTLRVSKRYIYLLSGINEVQEDLEIIHKVFVAFFIVYLIITTSVNHVLKHYSYIKCHGFFALIHSKTKCLRWTWQWKTTATLFSFSLHCRESLFYANLIF